MEDRNLTLNVEQNCVDEQLLEENSRKSAKNPTAEKKMSSIKWKYVVFFIIWLGSAWHLLTVKEKVLVKHDILLDSKHTKGI